VLGRHRHADVTIRDQSLDLPAAVANRDHAAVAPPHHHRRGGEVGVGRTGVDVAGHDLLHLHGTSSSRSPVEERDRKLPRLAVHVPGRFPGGHGRCPGFFPEGTTMKILIGLHDTEAAHVALEYVRQQNWPAGTKALLLSAHDASAHSYVQTY